MQNQCLLLSEFDCIQHEKDWLQCDERDTYAGATDAVADADWSVKLLPTSRNSSCHGRLGTLIAKGIVNERLASCDSALYPGKGDWIYP